MKTAVAVWNNRVSPVFDVSRQVLVLDIDNGVLVGQNLEVFTSHNPVEKVSRLAARKVETLICGAISQPLAGMLATYGIKAIPFVAGETDHVVETYLAGRLPNQALSMPGCFKQRRRLRKGRTAETDFDKTAQGGKVRTRMKGGKTMPRNDGTGPQGKGSGPGRGLGRCGGRGKQGPSQQRGRQQGVGSGPARKQGFDGGLGRGVRRTK